MQVGSLIIIFVFLFGSQAQAEAIRFGVNAFIPPYVKRNDRANPGISVEILKSVFKEMNREVEIEFLSNQRINLSFYSGDIDAALFLADFQKHSTITHHGPELLAFSNGFMCLDIKKCESLVKTKDTSLALSGFQNARNYVDQNFKDFVSKMDRYTEVTNQKEQIIGLISGKFDAVFGDERILRYHIRLFQGSNHFYSEKISKAKFHHLKYPNQPSRKLAFRDPKLRDDFAKAFEKLKKAGVVDKIIKKYE